ncbi:DUF3237 domain-containing protein [Aquidulcibacter sp.]|jgi:hypothetical protein|uniref:DUF3237 domain-containing protein n=1 Tax=Aquidulcibacter sp. TaxID=2052990 RepID=UPI003BA6D57D
MTQLNSQFLTALRLQVDFAAMARIGKTPQGNRLIAPVLGGRFEGPRLTGDVLPGGADWALYRGEDRMLVDVRLTLKTDDGALIYLTYQGALRASAEDMVRFKKGETLSPEAFNLRTVTRFETGAAQYDWLNDMIGIGVGTQEATGVVYQIFEVL